MSKKRSNVDYYRLEIDKVQMIEVQKYEANPIVRYGHEPPLPKPSSLLSDQIIKSGDGSIPLHKCSVQGTVSVNPPQLLYNQEFQNSSTGTLNISPMLGKPSDVQRSSSSNSKNPTVVIAQQMVGRTNTIHPKNLNNQIPYVPISENQMGNNLKRVDGILKSTESSSSIKQITQNSNEIPLNKRPIKEKNPPIPPNQKPLSTGNSKVSRTPKLPSNDPQLAPMPVINSTLPIKNQVPLPQVPSDLPIPGINFPPKNNIPVPSPPKTLPENNFLAGQPNFPIASGNPLLPSRNNLNLPSNPPIPELPIFNNPGLQGLPIPNIPSFPRIPNPGPSAMNFPLPPQGNPPFFSKNPQNPILSSSSSESSVEIQRVSINAREIENAQNSGDFMRIQNRFPKVDLFADNAGEEQEFINLRGSRSDAQDASRLIGDLRTESDTHWRYLDDDGKFQKYPLQLSIIIEHDFKNGNESSEILTAFQKFSIEFGTNGNPHIQLCIPRESDYPRIVRRGPYAQINKLANGDIIWYWSDKVSNKMKNYEPEACKAIELFYEKFLKENRGIKLRDLSGHELKVLMLMTTVLVLQSSGYSYLIDFANMVEINAKTRMWRGISRGNPNGTFRVSQMHPEKIPYISHPDLDY